MQLFAAFAILVLAFHRRAAADYQAGNAQAEQQQVSWFGHGDEALASRLTREQHRRKGCEQNKRGGVTDSHAEVNAQAVPAGAGAQKCLLVSG